MTSFGAFLQNQWRATRRLTLNLGARYDVTRLPGPFGSDLNNFSPRAGLAYSPSNKWVARAGLGLYYDRLPLAYLNRAIQKDGARAFEQVATDAEAARVFAMTGGGRALAPIAGIAPSIFRVDPEFQTPYSLQTNAGLERLLSTNVTARAEYLLTRGGRLPRTRNINLLPPTLLTPASAAALGIPSPTPQQLGRPVFGPGRIDPRLDAVYQLENSARSTYNGFTLSINKRYSNDSALLASYTVSRTTDDASDFDEQPANPYDLRAERALSRHHVGQRFVLSATLAAGTVAARRHLQRGIENPNREFYHGDKRVAHYRKTGEILPPESYTAPVFDVPTIEVPTDGERLPCVDGIVGQIQSLGA